MDTLFDESSSSSSRIGLPKLWSFLSFIPSFWFSRRWLRLRKKVKSNKVGEDDGPNTNAVDFVRVSFRSSRYLFQEKSEEKEINNEREREKVLI